MNHLNYAMRKLILKCNTSSDNNETNAVKLKKKAKTLAGPITRLGSTVKLPRIENVLG